MRTRDTRIKQTAKFQKQNLVAISVTEIDAFRIYIVSAAI